MGLDPWLVDGIRANETCISHQWASKRKGSVCCWLMFKGNLPEIEKKWA